MDARDGPDGEAMVLNQDTGMKEADLAILRT